MVLAEDLTELRAAMADWHLWENHGGMIRPLLPGTELAAGRDQLWARRDAYHPWQLDILLDPSGDEWVFKRDVSVRLPWDRAVQTVAGVNYLRPEVALLYKAQMDRPKDRDDLAAAAIDPAGREWLPVTLDRLGYDAWARLARNDPR